MKPNIVLLVVDSLREDYAQGLEALRDLGFVKYENAIAPAPWTLPSHVSMVTGLMPSQHGVHESLELFLAGPEQYARLARIRMHRLGYGILGELKRLGYRTAIFTANGFITPQYGFKADEVWTHMKLLVKTDEQNKSKIIWSLVADKRIKELLSGFIYYITTKILGPQEKGGRIIKSGIKRFIRRIGKDDPYFLLINIVEAHEPYWRFHNSKKLRKIEEAFIHTIVAGKCPEWAYKYVKHYKKFANIATKRAVEIAQMFDDNTLVIVTSDHGQGLCDPGFSHQYWLEDSVIRVPLWVKYPKGIEPLVQKGPISLIEIPKVIKATIRREPAALGGRACSETFGIALFGFAPFGYGHILLQKYPNWKEIFQYRYRCYRR
ncbi:MAG: sulfatase-like hydrolase/transferase [Pyrobaculum sp.]